MPLRSVGSDVDWYSFSALFICLADSSSLQTSESFVEFWMCFDSSLCYCFIYCSVPIQATITVLILLVE